MFERGHVYHRQNDLHSVVGGQLYGGIATPKAVPVVLLFTGEEGDAFGYQDGWQPDGSFFYSGEGQVGDQQFVRGNLAVRDHATNGKDLHLFEKLADTQYRHLGQFVYAGDHMVRRPDRNGNERDVIMFELLPLESSTLEDIGPANRSEDRFDLPADLDGLHRAALVGLPASSVGVSRTSIVRARSTAVSRYARQRAGGRCEACGAGAPFLDTRNQPFLEVHHIRRLSDGGPDHPRWVAAVCPNCHRRAHHGNDAPSFNGSIADEIGRRETELGHVTGRSSDTLN